MSIGTPRLHQQNVELFSRLNQELKSLQGQVGSGQADLKLSENLYDIEKLSAAEEKKAEIKQFMNNAKRAGGDLELVDLTLDRLQNLMIRLQELAVESGNDALSAGDRERYTKEATMIKKELFEVANQTDSQGNSIFGGISGKDKAFLMTTKGDVSYSGSALRREVQVSPSLYVTQNFSGQDVFENIGSGASKFKIFEMVDEFISSLKVDLNSGASSNLLSDGSSVDIIFPSSGAEATIEFILNNGASQNKISKTIYGNDYSTIVTEINNLTGSTGVSASVVSGNRVRLQGSVDSLSLSDFSTSNFDRTASNIGVIKDIATSTVVEKIGESRLQNGTISTKITEAFEHFATARAEVGSFSRRAQETEASSQDILITLEENISEIKEADLASLLTQIEFLMTNKEAAQATFTRITSKSLFDFLG